MYVDINDIFFLYSEPLCSSSWAQMISGKCSLVRNEWTNFCYLLLFTCFHAEWIFIAKFLFPVGWTGVNDACIKQVGVDRFWFIDTI